MKKRIETLADGVTLYLGDCLEILATLPKHDALVTDPPYGMAYISNHRTIRHRGIHGDGDNKLLWSAIDYGAQHSKYVFCRWDNLASIAPPKSCITWVKNNWSMGDLSHEHGRQTELILFYPGPEHMFPGNRPADVIYAARTQNIYHPTEKPIDLMEKIISWTAGGIIDPFMGSGTTGVAAVKMGRKFTGIEISEKYFDIACKRIEQALAQPDMLIEQEKKPEQIGLI